MTVEELEQEVVRLRDLVRLREEQISATADRIVHVNEHHATLVKELTEVEGDVRALTKSVRWLLAKARGEEESL